MFSFDDIFKNTVKKTQRLLEDDNIALSLREIKKLSTINLVGYRDEGERLLRVELAEKYGEDELKKSLGYQILYPFIDEGVIKTTTKRDEVFYTHFCVTEKRENEFDLIISEYDLHDGNFYYRYLMMLEGVPIRNAGGEISCKNIRQGCMKQFIFDRCTDKRLHQYYNELEYSIVKEFAEDEDKKSETQTTIIINQVISTFASINFLLEKNQRTRDNIEKSKHQVKVIKDIDKNKKLDRKIIALEDGIEIKMALPNEADNGMGDKTIKRQTGAWMVSGHLRHYKSGKVIFIEPYSKGPEKDNMKISKKEYDFLQDN